MIRRAALTWVAMIPVAILNGTFREVALKRVLDDQPARQISVATASIAFLVLAYLIMREYVVDERDQRLLAVGLTWLATTILFEFGFGHYVDGKSWSELGHDYNLFAGRLWPVFLGIEAMAPLLVKRFVQRQGTGIGQGRLNGPRPQGVS